MRGQWPYNRVLGKRKGIESKMFATRFLFYIFCDFSEQLGTNRLKSGLQGVAKLVPLDGYEARFL
jgi:hypothetical protein